MHTFDTLNVHFRDYHRMSLQEFYEIFVCDKDGNAVVPLDDIFDDSDDESVANPDTKPDSSEEDLENEEIMIILVEAKTEDDRSGWRLETKQKTVKDLSNYFSLSLYPN